MDADGNWVAGTSTYMLHSVCREEPKTGGTVVVADGSAVVFSSIIYLPKGTIPIQVTTKIKVVDQLGATRIIGDVKRFSSDSKNCRLWA